MKAVWIDNDGDYRIDDYMDIHPSSAVFTGDLMECNEYIESKQKDFIDSLREFKLQEEQK